MSAKSKKKCPVQHYLNLKVLSENLIAFYEWANCFKIKNNVNLSKTRFFKKRGCVYMCINILNDNCLL